MIKNYLLLLALCMATVTLFAQTKLIAHKSHSGSEADFEIAIRDEVFASDNDNFGLSPEQEYVTSLDSVIRVDDKTTILVTRSGTSRRVRSKAAQTTVSKDTVYDHPVLSGRRTLDSVIKDMNRYYGNTYDNPIDSVKFVGFDEKKAAGSKKKNSVFLVGSDHPSDFPPAMPSILFFAILVLVSLAAGLVYSRYNRLKQSIR